MKKQSAESETILQADGMLVLHEIKDKIIMLTMANEYLCNERLLEKIGIGLEQNIEQLAHYIEYLKKQFVGKPLEEVDLKTQLEAIVHIAKLLKIKGSGIEEECLKGNVGKELSEKVAPLASALKTLNERVDGRAVTYSKIESVWLIFRPIKFIAHLIAMTSKFLFRIIALFVLVCLMIFFFLFFTMETEKGPLKEIERINAQILIYRTSLSKTAKELEPILNEKERIGKGEELTRDAEIQLLDLNVKAHKLAEERQKTEIALKIEQEKLEKKQKDLEAIRKKSFLGRLLKLE